jgi:hypothetical protein
MLSGQGIVGLDPFDQYYDEFGQIVGIDEKEYYEEVDREKCGE